MTPRIHVEPFALVLTWSIAQAAVGLPVSWFEWVIPTGWLERTVQNL